LGNCSVLDPHKFERKLVVMLCFPTEEICLTQIRVELALPCVSAELAGDGLPLVVVDVAHAETIVREYGPFPDVTHVHGVSYDGTNVWIATGDTLNAIDRASGKTVRSLDVPAHAGTAFDGRYLYQISGDRIQKVDPKTGRVVVAIPTPDGGASGMAWAEGNLWVGQHRKRKIHQVDPQTGEILRTIESNRFVTGVTWLEGELWHGTWEAGESELRRIDPQTGEVLEQIDMPPGVAVSGLESDGNNTFFCGGGSSGKVRAIRRSRES
jgi:glutamine cyclotransferase